MRQHGFRGIIALTLLGASLAQGAAPKWVRMRSPNFELLTSAGERAGRRTIQQFERTRAVFGQGLGWDVSHPLPVRIVLFRSRKEFLQFRPGEVAAAYYLRTPDTDLIVMVAGSEPSTAIHEYAHLLVRRSGLEIPVWLNEGMAVLYSSMQQVGDKIGVGYAPPGHIATLQREKWLPLEHVVSADHTSEHYTRREHAGRFYSQSWALTHMLAFSEQFRPKYPALIKLLVDGTPSVQALETVYGVAIADLQTELRLHVRQILLEGFVIDVKLDEDTEKPLVEPATGLGIGLLLADLLAYTQKTEQARAMYRKTASDNPGAPGPYEGLGHLEYRLGDKAQAKAYFARAFELGSDSPRMLERYAWLQREAGDEDAGLTLVRAVKASPEDIDTKLALGNHLMRQESYAQVVAILGQVRNATSEQARRLLGMLAYARWMLDDYPGSQRAAEQLLELAQTSEEIRYAEGLLARLDQESRSVSETLVATPDGASGSPGRREVTPGPDAAIASPQEAEDSMPPARMSKIAGAFVRLTCFDNQARMDVAVDSSIVSLLIDDGSLVEIGGSDAGGMDLACGQQTSRSVVVRFLPVENPALGTRGLVRSIEFTKPTS